MSRTQSILSAFSLLAILVLMNACKDDDGNPTTDTDKFLYEMAKKTTGFTWYNNSDALLGKSGGSGHSEPFLRTRYNDVAAAMLDASGKVAAGTVFPDESLVVKELRNNASSVSTYAIMYKKNGHPDADAGGWVWGYLNSSGEPLFPASSKGSSCRGCHSQAENIDFTLMNKYFQ